MEGDAGTKVEPVPQSEHWLVVKEWWISVVTRLAKFMIKIPGALATTEDDQVEQVLAEVEIEAIAQRKSPAALLPLLEIILSCSVQCKYKENCIMQIMQLKAEQQKAMMASIQRTMALYHPKKITKPSAPSASGNPTSSDPVSHDITYKELYVKAKHAKDQLQAEKTNLTEQNAQLLTLVSQLETQVNILSAESKQQKSTIEELQHKQETQLDLSSPLRFNVSSKVVAQENDTLRASIAAHEKTINTLQQQLSSLSVYVTKSKELEDEVEMLREKSMAASQLERVSRQLEAKGKELAGALAKSKQLEEQLEAAQKRAGEQETIAKQVPQLKKRVEGYKEEIATLHTKLMEASRNQGSKSEETEALKTQLQNYVDQAEQYKAVVAALEHDKAELNEALRLRPVALPAPQAATKPYPSSQKSTLGSEMRSLGSMLPASKGRQDEQVAQLTKELAAARDASDSLKLDLEDQLDSVSRIKESIQAEYMKTSDSLRSADEALVVLRTEFAQLYQERNNIQAELESERAKRAEVEAKIAEVSNALAHKETELARLQESSTAFETSAKEQKQRLESQIGELNGALARLSEQQTQNVSKIAELNSTLATREREHQALATSSSEEKTALANQVKQIQQRNAQSVEEVRRTKEALTIAEHELDAALVKVEAATHDLSTQQDENHELNTQLDDLRHQRADLERQIANMELEREEMEGGLQEYMNRELAAVESSIHLKNEAKALTEMLDAKEAELATIQAGQAEVMKMNEDLAQVTKALRAQLIAQQKDLTQLKQEEQAVVQAYQSLGLAYIELKMGGVPKPPTSKTPEAQGFSFSPSKATSSPNTKSTGSTSRIPLKERSSNIAVASVPSGPCGPTSTKARRLTMAEKALARRPGHVAPASALTKC